MISYRTISKDGNKSKFYSHTITYSADWSVLMQEGFSFVFNLLALHVAITLTSVNICKFKSFHMLEKHIYKVICLM